MLLGDLIGRLRAETDPTEVSWALGDLVLLVEVERLSKQLGETVGEYVAGAATRFAAHAGSEDWLGMMDALRRDPDPTRAALQRIVRWSLQRDARELAQERIATDRPACSMRASPGVVD